MASLPIKHDAPASGSEMSLVPELFHVPEMSGILESNEKHSYRIYCRLRVPPCVEKTGNLVRLLEKYENCAIIYYVSLHAESNWDGWMLSLQTGGGE